MRIVNFIKKFNPRNSYNKVAKQLKIAMDGILRPASGAYYGTTNLIYPKYPFGTYQLYDMAYNSDVLTVIHNALRRELFRNGFDLTEAENTDEEETSSEEEISQKMSRKEILDILENINENKQSVIDVLMELEDDFSILDDAFMIFIFEYSLDNKGDIIGREFSQAIRGDPRFMGLVMNKYDRPGYDNDNVPLYVCPQHRAILIEGGEEKCSQCGSKCFKAFYFSDYSSQRIFYFSNEVVFKSKYRPSKRRGYSPIIAGWQKIRTLSFMDKYIMEMYVDQRPPKHGLFFSTANQDGLRKALEEAKEKVDQNPHWPLTVAVPPGEGGKEFVKFIDFMRNLNDLQYTEMRNEYRTQLGAMYGVEPIYQGDLSQAGGLNNEGLQLTVTTRAIEYGQAIHNDTFLKKLMEAMGAKGWSLLLNPSEEQDEMAKLDRQLRTLQNGQIALGLGLEASYDSNTGEVVIEDGDLELVELPGMPGESPFDIDGPEAPAPSGSISMEDKLLLVKARARPPFTKLADVIKREIDMFTKKFKRKPTEKELKREISKINNNLVKELEGSTSKLFKSTYKIEAGRIAGSLGVKMAFDKVDLNAVKVLSKQKVLSKAYKGIADNMTGKINNIITEAFKTPKGLSLEGIKDKIKDLTDVADFKAETIARTEIGKVSAAARKNTYQKEKDFDKFLFKHIGPNDNRTTETSKRIKKRVGKGVIWKEYVDIIKQESAKDFPKWIVKDDFPVSHYNSRHIFVRAVNP